MTDCDKAMVPVEIELEVEEVEEVIAPITVMNHNETIFSDEVQLNVDELEEVISPVVAMNHNETLRTDEIELEIELEAEELEEIIAPNASSPSIDVEMQKLRRERLEEKALRRARALYRC